MGDREPEFAEDIGCPCGLGAKPNKAEARDPCYVELLSYAKKNKPSLKYKLVAQQRAAGKFPQGWSIEYPSYTFQVKPGVPVSEIDPVKLSLGGIEITYLCWHLIPALAAIWEHRGGHPPCPYCYEFPEEQRGTVHSNGHQNSLFRLGTLSGEPKYVHTNQLYCENCPRKHAATPSPDLLSLASCSTFMTL